MFGVGAKIDEILVDCSQQLTEKMFGNRLVMNQK